MRGTVHRHHDVLHHQGFVQGHANGEVVNRLTGWPYPLSHHPDIVGFGVAHFTLDIPSSIVPTVTTVSHITVVQVLASSGGGQRQGRLLMTVVFALWRDKALMESHDELRPWVACLPERVS